MMNTALVLHLNVQQAEQLAAQCAAWRKYALQGLPASLERNQILRAVQAVEGRLLSLRKRQATEYTLSLHYDEAHALHQVILALMHVWGKAPNSEERIQAIGNLVMLRVMIERVLYLRDQKPDAGNKVSG
jgi:hypothetical protein